MRYSATTSAPSANIIELARQAFGPHGAGLRMTSVGMTEVRFDGDAGIGHVTIAIERRDGTNEVVIETREFDDEAVRFISQLPRPSLWRQLRRRIRSKT